MRAVFLGLLACSWVGVLHAQLVSPSMLHWMTREGDNSSEVYHIYYNFTSGYCRERIGAKKKPIGTKLNRIIGLCAENIW